jgi:hypothetical protein
VRGVHPRERENADLRAAITTLLFNIERIEPTPFRAYSVVRDEDVARLRELVTA